MSPHSTHLHKRVPKPQLLKVGLPVSLPSSVGNLLNPVVQIGSSSNSATNQSPKQNPPPKSSSNPSPVPSSSPSSPPPSSSPSSSPPSGGTSEQGGNGGSSNGGNQSSDNGSNGNNGNGNEGNSNGNGQGSSNGNGNSGGQSNTANGNSTPSQSGTTDSTGSSGSQAGSQGSGTQSQPSSNEPFPGGNTSSSSSGTISGAASSPSSSTSVSNNSNGGAINSESTPASGAPPRGEISGSNGSGDTTLQGGNAGGGNNIPSKAGQSQPSTGSGNLPNGPGNAFNTVSNGGDPSLNGATVSANSPIATNNPTSSGATGSKSNVGGVAAGIVVSLVALALIACILFFLRRRHQRKQAERRVTWISGFVDGQEPDMVERSSIRSSWGTPIERLTSWARTSNEDPFAFDASQNALPVLPQPVHSPPDVRRPHSASPEVPENPFSDVPGNAQDSLHLPQVPSTLPIRLSLISAGSCQDPFDDANRTVEPIGNSNNGRTTSEQYAPGHGPTQANFPMPPSTPASVKSGIAIGSPSDLGHRKELLAPSITFSFPDSPISPTFASPDTASYLHRVSVKHDFRASQARSDEVHLEKGEEVNVVSVYEDGWAFVQREKDNERGLVPLNCLDL